MALPIVWSFSMLDNNLATTNHENLEELRISARTPRAFNDFYYWVPNFFERHCPTKATLDRYEDAWKWVALWLQNNRVHSPRQLT
jgi:hypothetical protein